MSLAVARVLEWQRRQVAIMEAQRQSRELSHRLILEAARRRRAGR